MYLPVYDERHRAIMVPREKEKFHQKGIREHLLCDQCEQIISALETYAAPIVKAIQNLDIKGLGEQYIVNSIQYADFKLFQLSLLWRASIASVSMFQNFDIGHHSDIIRKMLLSKKPGMPDEYGCVMFIMTDTKNIQQAIWSPVIDEIDGHTCFRFLTGRIFWFYFLQKSYPPSVINFFLHSSGTLRLVKSPWSEETVIKRLVGECAKPYVQ
jgi:hypothetical protein